MTDVDRLRLAELRTLGNCDAPIDSSTHALCQWAADEIERLAEEVRKLRVELVERSIYD